MIQSQHLSSSLVQREIEIIIISEMKRDGYIFPENDVLKSNYKLDIHCEYQGNIVIGEIYAGIDTLKAAQKKKVLTDCFKLLFVEKILTEKDSSKKIQKLIIFIDDKIKNKFIDLNSKNDSWVKDAIKTFGIDLKTVNISAEAKEDIRQAKIKQQLGMEIRGSIFLNDINER
jgi:hypothetical protein